MARVLVTRRLTDGGTDPLVQAGHDIVGPAADDTALTAQELCDGAAASDALVCLLTDRIDADVLRAGRGGGRLRVIGTAAVGYDNIDVSTARAVRWGGRPASRRPLTCPINDFPFAAVKLNLSR